MFERTKNFWNRLAGHSVSTNGVALQDGADERRDFIRFPANLKTTLKPAGSPDGARLSARVRNISLGGINLLTNQAFQPGDMLTVELPGANDHVSCNVLACVVHCVADQDDSWSLGCTFSRELDDDDLALFGAKRERHDPADQRQWKRYPSNITATFQQVVTDDPTLYAAKVLNISPTGVGLHVDRDVENGALLSVELHNAAGTTERTMLACVVHVNAQPDGTWALGCNFIRSLSEEELKALL